MGRLDFSSSIEEVFNIIEKTGLDLLPITLPHILTLSNLPQNHNDPFDRIIISQAITEKLTLLSKDSYFENYQVSLFWDKN